MINIIIYEDNEESQKNYQEIIKSYFKKRNIKIQLYIFKHYIKNLEVKLRELKGKKIFILDVEVPGKSGLDLARIIRTSGDWQSPLIVVTSYEHLKNTGFTSKMLMLDFISKRENLEQRLAESLDVAYDILNITNSYTFQYNGELYHILYRDILYFEKDLNDNYCFLHTKDNTHRVKESIVQIEKDLEKYDNFIKTHRSCIINKDNIRYLDLKENIIYFENTSTNLITKANKEILKRTLHQSQLRK